MKKLLLTLLAILFTLGYFIYKSVGTSSHDGLLHIFILDIGQGDAMLIQTPEGKNILIDAGPSPQIFQKKLKEILPGVSQQIDIIILSHPDKDHAFGIQGLQDMLQPRLLMLSQVLTKTQYQKILQNFRDSSEMVFADAKKDFVIGPEIHLDTLYPFSAGTGSIYDPTNDGSIIQKLTYRNFSMLFTGDIGKKPLEKLTQIYGGSLKSTVLKMPHHGSKNNWTEDFLEAVRAPVTSISSGKNNSYHHPSPETLEVLKKIQTQVYGTQELGTVELKTDGHFLDICYKKSKKQICQDKLFLDNSQK